MKIYIVDSKNDRKPIFVNESDFVSAIRQQMKQKYNMNDEVELLYNGNILQDHQNLAELDIIEGSTITYVGMFKAG